MAEYAMLVEGADAELRPLSNWLRVSILHAFRARSKRASRSSRRGGEARALRPLQVMARITEDERDMLDVLAGESDTTVSGWLRATVRSAYAKLPQARSSAS